MAGIVRHRKLVAAVYIAAILACALLAARVGVIYDLQKYLPEDARSTIDLHIMEDSFTAEIPNAQLMAADISEKDAERLEKAIAEVEGVKNVSWISDLNVMNTPVHFLPKSLTDSYYKDGNALYSLTLDNEREMDLLEDIRALTDKEMFFSGTFVNNKVAQSTAKREVFITVGLVIIFAAFLLYHVLTSFAEVAALILCLLAAVVLNAGTNLIFGSISSMTNTAGSVLQMGVCVDYSIFLLHRYDVFRRSNEKEAAMVMAMKASAGAVLSSSVTTIIGFAALIFMRYRIGMDMGLVLAKGVALSLITSFTLLPAVILFLDGLIQKRRHKPFGEHALFIRKLCGRVRYPVMILFTVLAFVSLAAKPYNRYYYGSAHIYRDTHRVMTERGKIEEAFGRNNTLVLLIPSGSTAEETKLVRELKEIPALSRITSYTEIFGVTLPESMVPKYYRELFRSEKYSRLILNFDIDEESPETFSVIDRVRRTAEARFPKDTHLIGNSVSVYDLKKVISADNIRINLITGGAIFAVLLITLRSFFLPVILTLCIEGSAWIMMASFIPEDRAIFYIGYLVVTSILLGCTVDYAILVTSRFKEQRSAGEMHPVLKSVELSASSVITSALILTSGGVGLSILSTNQLVAQLGIMLARGTMTAAAAVLFALPGYLGIYHRLTGGNRNVQVQ